MSSLEDEDTAFWTGSQDSMRWTPEPPPSATPPPSMMTKIIYCPEVNYCPTLNNAPQIADDYNWQIQDDEEDEVPYLEYFW